MVYLIHFEKEFKGCRHYIGYTRDIEMRMTYHRNGNGSCLLNALNKLDIKYEIVRTWEGGYDLEKKLKKRKKAKLLCPICNKKSWKNNGKVKKIVG